MRRVSIVVAARHPIVLHGLETLLSSKSDFIVVASCQDGRKCLQIIRDLSPDIALLEMSLPGLTGLDILDTVESERLSTRVVFFPAAAGDRDMMIAATRGAYGFVPNETAPDDLVELLRQVANGQRVSPLMSCTSPREDGCAAGENILAWISTA
jgi:DNA-binding NarL/FixJ family response regulator